MNEENQKRVTELEREISQLVMTSAGAQARLADVQQQVRNLKGQDAVNLSWERVKLARHPKRPHSLDYIQRLVPDFTEIHGDRAFGEDPAIVCGFGHLGGHPVMICGQQKGRDTKQKLLRNFGMPKPEGYRKALRAMQLASKFRRPIITFLDTPGAYPGIDARNAARRKPSR